MGGRVILYPYKMSSKSANRLQDELTAKGFHCIKVYPDGEYVPRATDLIIGWGAGTLPIWKDKTKGATWLNHSDNICKAIDKTASFQAFKAQNVPTPEFTYDKKVAARWLQHGHKVVLRKKLEGMDGSGVELVDDAGIFLEKSAPLYTQFIPQTDEYRIHIFNGKVIDIQIKRKAEGKELISNDIRTTSNGWGLSRTGINCPWACQQAAMSAVAALGLAFGGVDVVWSGGVAYVLEVNTAPELTEVCTRKYAEAITSVAG